MELVSMESQNDPNDVHADDLAHDEEPLPPPGHPATIAIGRYLSDTLSLWRLCEVSRCKRRRRCMRVPPECLKACLPLLSDDVRAGGVAYIQGKVEGLGYDDLIAESGDVIMAMEEWLWRIEGCPMHRSGREDTASAAP
jgi:hypothetical protein